MTLKPKTRFSVALRIVYVECHLRHLRSGASVEPLHYSWTRSCPGCGRGHSIPKCVNAAEITSACRTKRDGRLSGSARGHQHGHRTSLERKRKRRGGERRPERTVQRESEEASEDVDGWRERAALLSPRGVLLLALCSL